MILVYLHTVEFSVVTIPEDMVVPIIANLQIFIYLSNISTSRSMYYPSLSKVYGTKLRIGIHTIFAFYLDASSYPNHPGRFLSIEEARS